MLYIQNPETSCVANLLIPSIYQTDPLETKKSVPPYAALKINIVDLMKPIPLFQLCNSPSIKKSRALV